MHTSHHLPRSPAEKISRLLFGGLIAGASLGVAALSAVVAACLLWWGGEDSGHTIGRAGRAIVTQGASGDFGWGELAVFAGVAAGFAVPLAILAWIGRDHARWLFSALSPPALAAALYASTLPDPMFVGDFPIRKTVDIRWPLLALGLQAIVVATSTLLLLMSLARARRWRPTVVAGVVCVVSAVGAAYLIPRGLTRIAGL